MYDLVILTVKISLVQSFLGIVCFIIGHLAARLWHGKKNVN